MDTQNSTYHQNENISAAVNNENDKSSLLYTYNILFDIFHLGVIPLTLVIGLFGNSLTLKVLSRVQHWTVTTISFLSLTIADVFVLLSSTVRLVAMTIRRWHPENKSTAEAHPYLSPLMDLSVRFTALVTVIIATERFIAISFPLHVKDILTKKTILIAVMATFLALCILHVPYVFVSQSVELYDNITGITTYDVGITEFGKYKEFWDPYDNFLVMTTQVMPVILVGVLSIVMIISVYRQKLKRKALTTGSQGQTGTQGMEFQVSKTIITVAIVFTFCLLPNAVIDFLAIANPSNNVSKYKSDAYLQRVMKFVAFEFQQLNSSVNFIIYSVVHKTYRQEYKQILHCGNGVSSVPKQEQHTPAERVNVTQETELSVSVVSRSLD